MKRHVLLALLLIASVLALPAATAIAQSSVTLSATTHLVMREGPSTGYQQIGTLTAGTSAPVLGRDALSYWAYIDNDGARGWVAAWLADVSGDLSSVPVAKPDGTGALEAPAAAGEGAPAASARSGTATATPTVNLRMRTGAGTVYQTITTIPAGTTVPVLEYDAAADWIKVSYEGQEGWAAAWLATIDGDLNNLSGELPAPAEEAPPEETPAEGEPVAEETPAPVPATPVSTGTYIVGQGIQPGIYEGMAGQGTFDFCYWARLSDLSGELDGIISNEIAYGKFYVEVKPTDYALETDCSLTPVASVTEPVGEFPQTLQPGEYIIGRDILPGTYQGLAGDDIMDSCYWERRSDVTGELWGIIANDNAKGQYYVDVQPGDFAFLTRCSMTRVGE